MDLQSIQARVPDYQTFMTVDELNQSSYDLAAAYPEVVKVETAGDSHSASDEWPWQQECADVRLSAPQ